MNPLGNNGQPPRKKSLKAPLRNNVGVGAGEVSNLSALSLRSLILSMSHGEIFENSMRKTIIDTLHTYVSKNMDSNSTVVLHDGYEMPHREILDSLVSRDTAVVSRGLDAAFILYCFGEAPHVVRALLEKLPTGILSNEATKNAAKTQLVRVFTDPEQYHQCSMFANPELPILNVLFGFRPEQAAKYQDVATLPALIGHITFKFPIMGPAGAQRVVRLPELIVSKLLRQPKFYMLLHDIYQMVAMTTPPNTPEYLHRLNTGILLAALTFIGFENNSYPEFVEAIIGLFDY